LGRLEGKKEVKRHLGFCLELLIKVVVPLPGKRERLRKEEADYYQDQLMISPAVFFLD
jgi:hypothetical protein